MQSLIEGASRGPIVSSTSSMVAPGAAIPLAAAADHKAAESPTASVMHSLYSAWGASRISLAPSPM